MVAEITRRALLALLGLMWAGCASSGDAGASTQQDGGGGPADGAVVHAMAVEPGVNAVGQTHPGAFQVLHPGDEVTLEWGFQGFHMAVVALRTPGASKGHVGAHAQLEVEGQVVASVKYGKAALLPGEDGYAYVYNLYMITEGWTAYVDRPGLLTVALRTAEGEPLGNASVPVVVRAPPAP